MKVFNKAAVAALVFILAFGCLASCTPEPPTEALESYSASITTTFSSTDPAMAEAIASFEKSNVTLVSYGEDLLIESETAIGDITLDKSYVVKDGVLYNTTILKALGKTVSENQRAPFDASKKSELLEKVGAGAELDVLDFNNVVTTTGNFECYTCSDIKDDARESLTAIFAAKFDDSATINLTNAEYYLEMRGNQPISYILNASFTVTMNSETYSVNMTIECDYNHNIQSPISAPGGAENYTETTYESIVG